MPRFASGVIRFQEEIYPQRKELFHKLSSGQTPEALFITCSDSRVEPAMITQTAPGELFICRNAGNIVPPHTMETGGMSASIEYALGVLKVPHIVICGHTECGAMKGALDLAGLDSLPHVKRWLGYAKGAVDVMESISEGLDPQEKMKVLLQQNVVMQLRHLKTHPTVATAIARNAVHLHGWVYDIRSGDVSAYDQVTGSWVGVAERYAAEIAAQALEATHG